MIKIEYIMNKTMIEKSIKNLFQSTLIEVHYS